MDLFDFFFFFCFFFIRERVWETRTGRDNYEYRRLPITHATCGEIDFISKIHPRAEFAREKRRKTKEKSKRKEKNVYTHAIHAMHAMHGNKLKQMWRKFRRIK